MVLGVMGLIAAYVLVALLLLSVNLYSNWSWRIKAALIIVVSLFYLVTYLSFPPLMGWPAKSDVPERFNLIAAQVREPDKLTGEQGRIYLWISEFTGDLNRREPRAYRLPFNAELHAKIVTATAKLKKGLPQLGEAEPMDDVPPVSPQDTKRGGQASVNIQFYDLPDPLFPDK